MLMQSNVVSYAKELFTHHSAADRPPLMVKDGFTLFLTIFQEGSTASMSATKGHLITTRKIMCEGNTIKTIKWLLVVIKKCDLTQAKWMNECVDINDTYVRQ